MMKGHTGAIMELNFSADGRYSVRDPKISEQNAATTTFP